MAVSSSVVTDCATATETSFTAVMLIETVASTESLAPSFTLKVNESPPVAFAVGVYTKFGAVPLKAPLVGPVTTVNFSVAPSTSVPTKVIA